MEIKKGIAVSPGVAFGPALVLESEDIRIPERKVRPEQIDAELTRLERAIAAAEVEARELQENTRADVGDALAGVFEAHTLMLRDPAMLGEVCALIRGQCRSAEYAVSQIMNGYVRRLQTRGTRMAERISDLRDVERRLLHHLIGARREDLSNLSEDVIVIAHDLTPSQTAALDRRHVRALATDVGGRTSHVAILARALGLPAVVGLKSISVEVSGGDTVILDGQQGIVVVRPNRETLESYRASEGRLRRVRQSVLDQRDLPTQTADGLPVRLLGNIEFPHEVADCLANGAQGIGLYRTEFLYLGTSRAPAEDDQYRAYADVIDRMASRSVTIRTLDLGADKVSEHISTPPERNPFLGVRSIRLCLQQVDLFKTQLRAILRASARGGCRVMFPLVSTLAEFRQARALLNEVADDLTSEGIPHDPKIPVGMMVEVPAAAYVLEDFCREADFFSVGTNDLVQYMLAVDRGNERVAHLYSSANPAVLKMLARVVQVANKAQREVSLCGEMASDPDFIPLLVGMGFRVLSVTAPAMPAVKQLIRAVRLDEAQALAATVLALDTERDILQHLRALTARVTPESL